MAKEYGATCAIWKCVKWTLFSDWGLAWNFIKGKMIQIELTTRAYKLFDDDTKVFDSSIDAKNLAPLLQIEHDLTTAIILADGDLEPVVTTPSAPPPYECNANTTNVMSPSK